MNVGGSQRCGWAKDPLFHAYHDDEWGRPLYADHALFECLTLEGAQAGLSWKTVFKRRDAYRDAFANFDIKRVADYDDATLNQILTQTNVIRHAKKIDSVRSNAKAIQVIQDQYGSFSDYVWSFVDGTPIQNQWQSMAEMPSQTNQSQQLSRSFKQHGFSFVGPTICYAFMQAAGLVNDHLITCKVMYDYFDKEGSLAIKIADSVSNQAP